MSNKEFLGEEAVNHGMTESELAMWFISNYAYIDGAHHKAWVLDQVARILKGTMVKASKASWSDAEKLCDSFGGVKSVLVHQKIAECNHGVYIQRVK